MRSYDVTRRTGPTCMRIRHVVLFVVSHQTPSLWIRSRNVLGIRRFVAHDNGTSCMFDITQPNEPDAVAVVKVVVCWPVGKRFTGYE